MDTLLKSIKIIVNDKVFKKDPESSKLGKNIIEQSILLIDEIGFDAFTFKKLGVKIGSNESSIYRYFENKHMLLLYLASWYWSWIEYQLVFSTSNIANPKEKLDKAIETIARTVEVDSSFTHVNEVALHRIIINEYSKSYLTKEVDDENKEGFFAIYKRLVIRFSDMIHLVNKEYPYPLSLASTLIEGVLHQHYLKDHFPSITDCDSVLPTAYFKHLIFTNLKG
ncbi:TetR/AcrR family transcriptional regulator [Patiriisocius hiemis]|uniref:TetR/AcrR family transcriptional regulator n=1 Tax=Patiriisocius hiemis TaxID=3075604 RepID=A0ABU2Y8S8_9FLAO|nr:TetR/AcrR family transcriptional regulator [Constantimarinum sp. W242]MDT0554442.1 TetR/AcrR family transcriptional regulator [Constantimarinum sp. W242]